jgi:hypothetical protein
MAEFRGCLFFPELTGLLLSKIARKFFALKYEEETEKPLGRWVQSATTATATARNLKKNENTIINFWLLLHLFFFFLFF